MINDPEALRLGMRNWATGVTIVTSSWKQERYGMTVNSFTSIALDPPVISVTLAKWTRTYILIQQSGGFGLSILSQEQADLSDRFAGRMPEFEDRFTGLETGTLASAVPFIPGSMAWLDCEVIRHLQVGDNILLLGRVLQTQNFPHKKPLVYFNRTYWELAEDR